MMPSLKLEAPKRKTLGLAERMREACRQQSQERQWRALADTPGSQSISSLRLGFHDNEGDPHRRRKPRRHSRTSLTSKEVGMAVWKSEPPIEAMMSGNADGAKGWQSETSARGSMGQTQGWRIP